MGLFSNMFKSGEGQEAFSAWKDLTSVRQLDEILEASKNEKVLVFKHSTRCGISTSVKSKLERKLPEGVIAYYLDLLNYRDISNAIADKYKVVHQSPQLIVLEDGQVKDHASHYDILELEF